MSAAANRVTARAGRVRVGSLLALGLACLGLLPTLGLTLSSPGLGLLLMGPGLLAGGLAGLAQGWALARLRLEYDDRGLRLHAPSWRGCATPPLRRLELAWPEVTGVAWRWQRYHPRRAGSVNAPTLLNIRVYVIHTGRGRVVLGQGSLPGLEQLMAAIAHRAGTVVRQAPAVAVGLAQALAGREPDWPPLPAGVPD